MALGKLKLTDPWLTGTNIGASPKMLKKLIMTFCEFTVVHNKMQDLLMRHVVLGTGLMG